jgi:hypothetical protein
MDKTTTCHTLYNDVRVKVEDCESPIPAMKAIKNETEVKGFREAMKRDGVALVKFLRWLKPAVEKGGETELSISRKLTSLRAEQPLFRDISFDTISAYQEHGAIVHYEPTTETDASVRPEGFLLLDSGAQYQDATTDITRTIPLGTLTDEQRKVYTLVLKGNINTDTFYQEQIAHILDYANKHRPQEPSKPAGGGGNPEPPVPQKKVRQASLQTKTSIPLSTEEDIDCYLKGLKEQITKLLVDYDSVMIIK